MPTASSTRLAASIHRLAQRSNDGSPTDGELLRRFVAHQDELAVATLVQRYGPLVLGVCRRVLKNQQDAEDAFQAAFLVLLHKARSIEDPALLANWLYGVAYNTARNARIGVQRRHAREREAANMARTAQVTRDEDLWELKSLLDDELDQLPEKYRVPIVLCELQGMSRKEAARRLSCLDGTLSSRLARARELLKTRLAKRGLTVPVGVLAAALASETANGAVATTLLTATVRLARTVGTASGFAAAPVPAKVAALAEGVLKTMFLGKLKVATALILGFILFAAGGTLTLHAVSARQIDPKTPEPRKAAQSKPKDRAKATQPDAQENIVYSGRVVDQALQPVPGAKLYVTVNWGYPHRPAPSPEFATSGQDGTFTFQVPKAEFGEQATVIAAAAANHAVDWLALESGSTKDLTICLKKEDVAISGEIVDLEGKPVAGATLRLLQIQEAPDGNLGPWIEASKAKKGLSYQLEQKYLTRYCIAVPMQVSTDAAGKFRLAGLGRNRLIRLQLDGPTLVSQHVCIVTRPGDPFEVLQFAGQPEVHAPREVTTYFGNQFRLAAAPTKPIVGVVRDQDTKQPLAGVTIQSGIIGIVAFDLARTMTDAQGRYRLAGMPKAEDCSVMAIPNSDQPYGVKGERVPTSAGLDAVTVNFELKRGVWIEGRITDKATGKPVKAGVQYSSVESNPNLRDYPNFESSFFGDDRPTGPKELGAYRVLGIPGPGLISVYPPDDHYLRTSERQDEFGANGIKEPSMLGALARVDSTSCVFAALARVNPAKGVVSVHQDITLDRGWSFTGTVVGPEGKPLAGSWILYCRGSGILLGDEHMKTATFTGWFNPKRPRDILLQHVEKGLVGVAHPPKANGAAVEVRMEPAATATGRLIGANGMPHAEAKLTLVIKYKSEADWTPYSPYYITTDAAGQFKLTPLVPGFEFILSDEDRELCVIDGLHAGETRNLGDLRQK